MPQHGLGVDWGFIPNMLSKDRIVGNAVQSSASDGRNFDLRELLVDPTYKWTYKSRHVTSYDRIALKLKYEFPLSFLYSYALIVPGNWNQLKVAHSLTKSQKSIPDNQNSQNVTLVI